VTAPIHELPIIELAGSPRRMGEQFGEACREDIAALCRARMAGARERAHRHSGRSIDESQVLAAAERCLSIAEPFDAPTWQEFAGIARGAGLTHAQLYAMQGLTDLADYLAFAPLTHEGCSSFIIGKDRADGGNLLIGQNWDLNADNMPFVRFVHRRPDDQPQTWSLTTVGCLTLIALNSEGIAVGNTNLLTCDARPGVHYLFALHKAIRQRTLEAAANAIADAPRLSGHYFYMADRHDRAVGLECSATRCTRYDIERGVFAHCNHALGDEVAEMQMGTPHNTSPHRQQRFDALLADHALPIGVEALKVMLADRVGGDKSIRVDNPTLGTATNACVIMCPGRGEIHACRSQADVGRWITRAV
jgi:isopenicillin-N N-acyltransferase-like protein